MASAGLFPQGSNGSVIITSRYKLAVSSMVEESDIIAIDLMDEAHAIALFEKILGARGEDPQELKENSSQHSISCLLLLFRQQHI